MSGIEFALDPRLAADTSPVASLQLCEVLLMNDARYPWLVLVPRRVNAVEIAELPESEQQTMWQEVNRCAHALRAVAPCEKLNIAALGIIVRQLHIHVVARNAGDATWPGPVWGNGRSEPYPDSVREPLIAALRRQLTATA